MKSHSQTPSSALPREVFILAMQGFVRRTGARFYDSAVIWALVFTAVRTGGNLLVLPLLLHKLSPDEMGLWYVFLSLSGISAMIDLGFSATMTRVTAFLWAGAQDIPAMGVPSVESESTGPNYRLLAELVQTMRLYYRAAGVVVTLLLATAGTMWIIHRIQTLSHSRWLLMAWLLFLPGVLINTTSGMWHPLLSGINRVRLNQQILVYGLVVNYIAIFTGLLLGAGLLAPVTGYLLMGLIARNAARVPFRKLTNASRYDGISGSVKMLRTLWPTAWRTGIVTLGLYATINLNTLICFLFLGLKATASFGVSLQLALAATGVANTFVAVKIPLISQMRARLQTQAISGLVFSRLRFFWIAFLGFSSLAISCGHLVFRDILHSNTPLLSTPMLVVLFVVIGLEAHHAIFREITLTSHFNPFATPVIVSAIMIVILSLALVQWIGLWGLILAPGLVQICFNNWWTVAVGLRSMDSSLGNYARGLFGRLPVAHSIIPSLH
ncbi:MAG: hypothetical protein ABI233_02395 [Chthoniobacterales bacterium]